MSKYYALIMKTLLLFLTLLLTICSCTKETNCTDFKTGIFLYAEEGFPQRIVRTETLQTETNPIDNITFKSSIEWTSDCEYILTNQEVENYSGDKSQFIGIKIYCEIVETNGNRLKVHVKSPTLDEVIELIKTES